MLSERRLPWINRLAAWQSRRFPILATYPQWRSMIDLRIRAPKGEVRNFWAYFTSSSHGVKTNGPSFQFGHYTKLSFARILFSRLQSARRRKDLLQ